MRRGGEAAERHPGEQVGVQPEVEIGLAFAADGAGKMDYKVGAGENLRPFGDQIADIALDPF